MLRGKAFKTPLTVGLIRKITLYKTNCFTDPNNCSKNKIKVKLNYATKADLQERQVLIHLIYQQNQITFKDRSRSNNADKLKAVPVDLSKLSTVVKIHVVKRIVYDELVKKFNVIQTNDLAKRAAYNAKIEKIELKISDHDKYITAPKVNKLTKESFAEKLKQVNLSSKNDIADFRKKGRL